LQGRTALVTGSTGGLGVAIAKALAAEGARVIVTGRNKVRGDAVVADIRSAGGGADFVAADLGAGEDEIRRLATAAGDVDILVNNAGVWSSPEPTANITEATLLESYRANVVGPFLLTGALAPAMVARGRGAVVNIGSITGLIGGDKSALYNSTKAAVHSLTKSWAAEYGPAGVRVNAVAPGPIATERAAEAADHVAPVLARIPSRRMSRRSLPRSSSWRAMTPPTSTARSSVWMVAGRLFNR
jgi:NAD(P)-dependent dehydrogenase (short-subunit alcohol dehydrogenase family)